MIEAIAETVDDPAEIDDELAAVDIADPLPLGRIELDVKDVAVLDAGAAPTKPPNHLLECPVGVGDEETSGVRPQIDRGDPHLRGTNAVTRPIDARTSAIQSSSLRVLSTSEGSDQ